MAKQKKVYHFDKKPGCISYRDPVTNGWKHLPIMSAEYDEAGEITVIAPKTGAIIGTKPGNVVVIRYQDGNVKGRLSLYENNPSFEDALKIAMNIEMSEETMKKPATIQPEKKEQPAEKKPAAKKAKKPARIQPAPEQAKEQPAPEIPTTTEQKEEAAAMTPETTATTTTTTAPAAIIAQGAGWTIYADKALARYRVVLAKHAKNAPALRSAVTAAGFYFSTVTGSYHKKLTNKAQRAAVALAAELAKIAA